MMDPAELNAWMRDAANAIAGRMMDCEPKAYAPTGEPFAILMMGGVQREGERTALFGFDPEAVAKAWIDSFQRYFDERSDEDEGDLALCLYWRRYPTIEKRTIKDFNPITAAWQEVEIYCAYARLLVSRPLEFRVDQVTRAKGKICIDPVVIQWTRENPRIWNDPELQLHAIAEHQSLIQNEPHLSLAENLGRVKASLTWKFPNKLIGPGISTHNCPSGWYFTYHDEHGPVHIGFYHRAEDAESFARHTVCQGLRPNGTMASFISRGEPPAAEEPAPDYPSVRVYGTMDGRGIVTETCGAPNPVPKTQQQIDDAIAGHRQLPPVKKTVNEAPTGPVTHKHWSDEGKAGST